MYVFQMLAGEHLFNSDNQLFNYDEEETLKKVNGVIDDPKLAALVKRMLAKDPEQRPRIEEAVDFFKVF